MLSQKKTGTSRCPSFTASALRLHVALLARMGCHVSVDLVHGYRAIFIRVDRIEILCSILVEMLCFLAVQRAIVVLVGLIERGRSLVWILHAFVAGVLVLLGILARIVLCFFGIRIRRARLRRFGLLGSGLHIRFGCVVSREDDGCSAGKQSCYQKRNNGTLHTHAPFLEMGKRGHLSVAARRITCGCSATSYATTE